MAREDAAIDAGISPPVGTRWFREAGGMPPSASESRSPFFAFRATPFEKSPAGSVAEKPKSQQNPEPRALAMVEG
jgi:hypothetical protein